MTRQIQTVDESGWTHIPPRNSKQKPLRRRRLSLRSSSPPPPLPPRDELLARLKRLQTRVRELDVLRSVVENLDAICQDSAAWDSADGAEKEEAEAAYETPIILLLLGLGRVELEVGMWQLALAMEILEPRHEIQEAGKQRRKVLKAYDPVWSTEEIEFMNSIPGVEVVNVLEVSGPSKKSEDELSRDTSTSALGVDDAPIILLAPHLELDVLGKTFEVLGLRIVGAVCNDLKMGGLESEIGARGWKEDLLPEVKEAAQGRAFNHMAVYVPIWEKIE